VFSAVRSPDPGFLAGRFGGAKAGATLGLGIGVGSLVGGGDGSITLEHVSGPITAKSLDGSVELSEVEGPVDARSEAGTVSASFTHATGGSLETGVGTVSVTLPEGGGAALDARAARGGVELASSLAWDGERSDGHAVGTLGAGGPRLVLRCSRGEIRVSGR